MIPEDSPQLRAVLAAPDEDEPRLAYAQLCAARKDPRDLFIRTQIALARRPRGASSPETFLLRDKEDEMLTQYQSTWSSVVIPPAHGATFHRGFVALVKLSAAEFIQNADTLFQRAPIQHLDLTATGDAFSAFLESPHLLKIRSLSLQRCEVTDAVLQTVAAAPNLQELRWLSLAQNRVTFAGADALASSVYLAKLKAVDFALNPIDVGPHFADDSGVITEIWLGEDGQRLKAKHPDLAWLSVAATTVEELQTDRFALGMQP